MHIFITDYIASKPAADAAHSHEKSTNSEGSVLLTKHRHSASNYLHYTE